MLVVIMKKINTPKNYTKWILHPATDVNEGYPLYFREVINFKDLELVRTKLIEKLEGLNALSPVLRASIYLIVLSKGLLGIGLNVGKTELGGFHYYLRESHES